MKKLAPVPVWDAEEYSYPMAFGFEPDYIPYLHEDAEIRPCMIVVPGGGYCVVSPTEGELVAKAFYEQGYNCFVTSYTTNLLMACPLYDRALRDLSRCIRKIRSKAAAYCIDPDRLVICGFSAGAHLCGSVAVHYGDVKEENPVYAAFSGKPQACILSYPVISSDPSFAHQDSFRALLGTDIYEREDEEAKKLLAYWSLEKNVTKDTVPCFVWQTITDELVPVKNSQVFSAALVDAGVTSAYHLFSDGKHGLSVATEEWAAGKIGDPHCIAQTTAILDAVKAGQIPMAEEQKQGLLAIFGAMASEEPLGEANPEAAVWPVLAGAWLKKQLG